jgi:hypothetical protein
VPRTLLAAVALALLGLPCRADETTSTSETLIRLSVPPAPAPRPALRYQLLPELKEMNPGNPCYNYLRCFMEQQKFFFDKEAFERRQKLLAMPIKELPAQELQDYGRVALSQADWAARLDAPDWQMLLKVKTDGVGLLLPDLSNLRTLADPLKVRFRAEIALGRFDAATRTAQTMFALSRHLGQHPTLVGNLVGFAIATVAIGPLEEMLEQPGCPNLYWALTSLPSPLVAIDKGMEGERLLTSPGFHDLDDHAPMSQEKLKTFLAYWDIFLGDGAPPKPGESRMRAWHNGALPAKLSEIALPLPDDPITGKPFRYELIGNTAHLRGSPPPGEDKDPIANVHYAVTLQK